MKTRRKSIRPLVAALTGSIGSGKSEVALIFEEFGAVIIDADALAREVVRPGTGTLEEIRAAFGDAVVDTAGQLKRKALGEIVFSDPKKRKLLEKITHPRIRDLFRERLAEIYGASSRAALVLYVVPLYFESGGAYPEVEKVVVVSAPMETCIARIMERDRCERELAVKKYESQLSPEDKEKQADFVINNSADLDALRSRVREVYAALTIK